MIERRRVKSKSIDNKDGIMDEMKCHIVCNGCHLLGDQGNTDFEYELSINQNNTLKYPSSVSGDNHR